MVDFKRFLVSLAQKLFAYVEIARFSVIFMGLPFAMAGAAFALSQTLLPISIWQAIAGILIVFLVTGAIHTVDDYFDRQRDRSLWPNRPLPSRATTPRTALLIISVSLGFGFTLALIFFNLYCVVVLFVATVWAIAYTGYLREKFGYLTLPFAIGLFPVGGYVAFSSQTLWIDPIPWLLYIMVFCWQSAHILAYSPPHGVRDGKTQVPLFLKRFSARVTLMCSAIFAGSCMSMGIIIYVLTNLSYLYLGITVGLGLLLVCLAFYFAENLSLKNCMRLVFLNSMYGALVFLEMTLEFLYHYDLVFFYAILFLGIFMMILTPILGGFGVPNNQMERRE
jgi:4-hydroxybenzoate polyprenyltransferase